MPPARGGLGDSGTVTDRGGHGETLYRNCGLGIICDVIAAGITSRVLSSTATNDVCFEITFADWLILITAVLSESCSSWIRLLAVSR